MTKVTYPTKEEWLKSTGELLAGCEEKIAAFRRAGTEIPKRLFEIAAEIRITIEQRSKWTENDFDTWRNAPSPREVGHEEYVRDYPHLQNLYDD